MISIFCLFLLLLFFPSQQPFVLSAKMMHVHHKRKSRSTKIPISHSTSLHKMEGIKWKRESNFSREITRIPIDTVSYILCTRINIEECLPLLWERKRRISTKKGETKFQLSYRYSFLLLLISTSLKKYVLRKENANAFSLLFSSTTIIQLSHFFNFYAVSIVLHTGSHTKILLSYIIDKTLSLKHFVLVLSKHFFSLCKKPDIWTPLFACVF